MNFSFVLHWHQPAGQLPWVFDEVDQNCYAPLLETLSEYPEIPVAIHVTGPLLDWFAAHRPERLEALARGCQNGSIELLGGGFYEPILAVWDAADARAQLKKLSARVQEISGEAPALAWLAERVWEPQLAPILANCGLQGVFVDDNLVRAALPPAASTCGVFRVASEAATPLHVFPINEHLRGLIPWHEPSESIAYLRELKSLHGAQSLAVFADDGEKFGAWPGTFDFIHGKGDWLRRFLEALGENDDWLSVVRPRKYLQQYAAQALEVDVAPGSYPEMLAWSGGRWANFLERYGESRDLWSEARRVADLTRDGNSAAYENALRAQSNDGYWHGTFGGLYLRHLRQAVATDSIAARVACQERARPESWVQVGREPMENVSTDDVFLENESQRIGVRAAGGAVWLWAHKAKPFNWLSTLRRHRERYHRADAIVDWYPRAGLLDHFLRTDTTPESLAQSRFGEEGDFISEAWQIDTSQTSQRAQIVLQRDGGVWHDGQFKPLQIHKTLSLAANSDVLEIEYRFVNTGASTCALWWGHEWNVALSAWSRPQRFYRVGKSRAHRALDESAIWPHADVSAIDRWQNLQLSWQWNESENSRAMQRALWHLPLYTLSEKEGGETERSYQQSCFLWLQPIQLEAGAEFTTHLNVSAARLENAT